MATHASASPPIRVAIPRGAARQAVRLTYIQSMLGAVYGASTGGMFLIGYALLLGATNVHIGLMSTIPMLCIGVQLVAAAMIERGVSRRLMTFVASMLNVVSWIVVILIPYAAAGASSSTKAWMLICVITAVTFFAYVAGNARGSWVGDLIPARFRGTFFGRAAMYSGIVASLFAIGEGAFLDVLKTHGLPAFSLLFGFGITSGPLWGRIVDRWGCRPVLHTCASVLGLLPFAWYWVDTPLAAYRIVSVLNLVGGACASGVGVALGVLVYKATPTVGRSIHLATYSIVFTLVAAPFPWIGGHLPGWLEAMGFPSDIRFTFYLAGAFTLLSSLVTKRIHEPGAGRTREMLRELSSQWLSPVLRWIT